MAQSSANTSTPATAQEETPVVGGTTTPLGSPAANHLGPNSEDMQPMSLRKLAEIIQGSVPYSVLCYIARRLLTIVLNRVVAQKKQMLPTGSNIAADSVAAIAHEKAQQLAHSRRILRIALYILSTATATYGTWLSFKFTAHADTIRALPERTAEELDAKREKKQELVDETSTFVEFLLGYFIHDVLAQIDQWREYPADMIHHGVGISLASVVLLRPRLTMDFVPAFCRLEASTVALNLMWFFREFPDTLPKYFPFLDKNLPKIFVALYFSIRMVWFPWYLYHVATTYPVVWHHGIGSLGKGVFFLLHGLQVHWFGLIVKKMISGR